MATHTRDERQGDLLRLIERIGRRAPQPQPASLNVDVRLRSCVSEAIRRFDGDRYDVAARMSRLLAVEVTKSQLDAWTAESKEHSHRLPAAYLPAFCAAVGDWSPLRMLAETGGHRLDTDPDVTINKELGQLERELDALKDQVREKDRLRRQALALLRERQDGGRA